MSNSNNNQAKIDSLRQELSERTRKRAMNNNQELIASLRQAADYLEAHPDIPKFRIAQRLWHWVESKEELRAAARAMGSFAKKFDDRYLTLTHRISDEFAIDIFISRDMVCKRVTTWDCPDDESLLRDLEGADAGPKGVAV